MRAAFAAFDLPRGSEVLVPAYTFPAPAHAALLLGLKVVPVDVDPETWNLCPQRVADTRTASTRVVLAVDQFGLCADYSALHEANTIDVKIITTEDPVEYDIDGLVQIPIDSEIGVTFAACLRSILRHDPDRILVGEIRDLETAEIAVQASLTGHTVFSTLHTTDAPPTITRLKPTWAYPRS